MMEKQSVVFKVTLSVLSALFLWRNSRYLFSSFRTRSIEEKPLTDWESQITVREGITLNVLYRHHKSNVCFLFIHGLGGQLAQFAHQIRHLSQYGTVFAVDIVGHGQSTVSANPGDYAAAVIARDIVAAFVQKTRLDAFNKIILVGHSYGCPLAVRVANALSDEAFLTPSAMVLLAPSASMSSKFQQLQSLLGKTPLPLVYLLRFFDSFNGLFSASVSRLYHKPSFADRIRQLRWNSTTPSFVIKSTVLNASLPSQAEYSHLKLPVLLIYGLHDSVTPYDPDVVFVKSALKKATLVVHGVDSGHLPMWEVPQVTHEHIHSFLKQFKFI